MRTSQRDDTARIANLEIEDQRPVIADKTTSHALPKSDQNNFKHVKTPGVMNDEAQTTRDVDIEIVKSNNNLKERSISSQEGQGFIDENPCSEIAESGESAWICRSDRFITHIEKIGTGRSTEVHKVRSLV